MKFSPAVNRRIIVLTGVLGACVAVGFFAYTHRQLPDVVVTRTATGFVPAKVTIRTGQAVVFTSAIDSSFWPASNFHPTHSLYPAFDPKHALAPGESWRFVFTKAGVWNYHDHLAEDMRGTVTVLGRPGESTANCLALAATSTSGEGADCWAATLTETLRNKGLQSAFDVYAALYNDNPSFRGLNCHDAGHILGAEAYKEFSDDHTIINRPETSYCGYGFYHGFMEAMLQQQGPSQYSNVRSYCDSLKSNGILNNPSGACYHGVGHAAFDSIPGEAWGNETAMVQAALHVCELAAVTDPDRAQCGSGVFNALAVAESAHTYGLSFSPHDPMSLCRVQPKNYQAGCYGEFGLGVIREEKLDRSATVRFIESVRDPDAIATMIRGYAGDEAIRAIASIDLPSYRAFCDSFATQENKAACSRGVLAGLRQGGAPGNEYPLMFAFCSLYPAGDIRTNCYSFTVSQTKGTATDADAFSHACQAIKDSDARRLCQ